MLYKYIWLLFPNFYVIPHPHPAPPIDTLSWNCGNQSTKICPSSAWELCWETNHPYGTVLLNESKNDGQYLVSGVNSFAFDGIRILPNVFSFLLNHPSKIDIMSTLYFFYRNSVKTKQIKKQTYRRDVIVYYTLQLMLYPDRSPDINCG